MRFLQFFSTAIFYAGIHKAAGNAAYEQGKAIIEARSDLSFCYGKNAICSLSLDLYDQCDTFRDLDDRKPWYNCVCGNGYVSADESCNWCEEAYGISYIDLNYRDDCASITASVAPLPSTVLAAYSSWNATYTGVISGAAADGTNRPSVTNSGAQTSADSSPSSTPTRTAKPKTTRITTGVTVVETFTGAGSDDSIPTVTTEPIPTFTGPFSGGDDESTSDATASGALRSGGDSTDAASELQDKRAIPVLMFVFGLGIFIVNFCL